VVTSNSSGTFFDFHVKSSGKLAPYVSVQHYDGTGVNTLVSGTWYYLVMTYDVTNGEVGYVNAGVDGTAAANGPNRTDNGNIVFEIGNDAPFAPRFVDGVVDEVRVSNIARSADWITAEYNNQLTPASFYTVGSEQ
jgi:hypothetical protein